MVVATEGSVRLPWHRARTALRWLRIRPSPISLEGEWDRVALWSPVLLGAGAAIFFAYGPDGALAEVALAALICFAGALWHRSRAGLFLVACAAGLLLFGHAVAQWRVASVVAPTLGDIRGARMVEGRVVAVEPHEAGTRVVLAVEAIERLAPQDRPARLRLTSRKELPLSPGDPVRIRAVVLPPPGAAVPGGYDFGFSTFFDAIGAIGFPVGPPELLERTDAAPLGERWTAFWWRLRLSVTERVQTALPGEKGALAAALVTGMRGGIPQETEEALRAAGLAHILAISGMHMALIAGGAFWTLRAALASMPGLAVRWPIKKWAAGAALLFAAFYLFLSGASVATQRAFIMTAIVFLAIMLDRPALTLRNVALAALVVLLLRPEAVISASFQMSFAAATLLVAGYERLRLWRSARAREQREFRGPPWLRTAVLFLGGIALTSLLAGFATGPYAAFHFNRVAVFGLLGNIAAMPVFTLLVMPMAVAALVLLPLGLEAPPLAIMGIGLEAMVAIAEQVAALEGALVAVKPMPVFTLVSFTLAGLWVVIWRRPGVLVPGLLWLAAWLGWWRSELPEIIVNDKGTVAAVRTDDGQLAILGRRPSSFVLEQWSHKTGIMSGADGLPIVKSGSCDRLGCTMPLPSGGVLSLSTSPEGLEEDCRLARIVVASYRTSRRATTRCAVPLISQWDLKTAGPHALVPEGSGFRILTARDPAHPRPWHRQGVSTAE